MWSSASIKPNKLLDTLMKSDEVSDDTKLALAEKRRCDSCTAWKRQYEAMRGANGNTGAAALEDAERPCSCLCGLLPGHPHSREKTQVFSR